MQAVISSVDVEAQLAGMRAAVASAVGPAPPAGNSAALAACFRGVVSLYFLTVYLTIVGWPHTMAYWLHATALPHSALPLDKLDAGLQAKRAGAGAVVVSAESGTWALAGDALALLERMACESIPPFRDDKATDPLASRNAQARRPRASHSPSQMPRGGAGPAAVDRVSLRRKSSALS